MKTEVESTAEEYVLSEIKLTKDLKTAAKELADDQVRYLVDRYYQIQNNRIRADLQARETETPNALLQFDRDHAWKLETLIKNAMKVYSVSREDGKWLLGVHGIGAVLSAGFLAHIDISKVRSPAGIWRFAGLDPTVKWKKKTKRPWNAELKVLCWKAGESFVKQSGKDQCFYGKLWAQRKVRETNDNANKKFEEQAKTILETKKFKKDTEAYKAYVKGYLPKAHIQARSTRWVVKLFLSHLYEVMYWTRFREKPPVPFAFDVLGHSKDHFIPVPGFDPKTLPHD